MGANEPLNNVPWKPSHGVMCGSPDEPCSCTPPVSINQLYSPNNRLGMLEGAKAFGGRMQEIPMGPLPFPDNTALLKEILEELRKLNAKF